jgi:hypothetical protein
MRRALALVGLITLGVLLGFLVRLLWPHRGRLTGYHPPAPGASS